MEHMQETIDKIKTALPAEFDVYEFAMAVAHTLLDEYGEHNIERFINTLTNEINTQQNDNTAN